jgi:choline dehydrogenase
VQRLDAESEIIVSGGTINSPQLLQLSGIGNPDHLKAVGVKVLHPLPGVGENLQDHVNISVSYYSTQPVGPLRHVRPMGAALALARYFLTNSGPATVSEGAQVGAFIKTRPGLIAPDLQYFLVPMLYVDHGRKLVNADGFMTYINMTRPESRGTIRVKSADPTHHPAIDPHYLQAGKDLRLLRDAIAINRSLVGQKAFDAFRGEELAPGRDVRSDDDIDAFVRATGDGIYHPVGTCKMGRDEMAVVDDELRVRGIENLRVVDASIMPLLVSGNTNAPTIMIAEKASDIILGKIKRQE